MIYRSGFLALLEETIGRPLHDYELLELTAVINEEDTYITKAKTGVYVDPKLNERAAFYSEPTYHHLSDVKGLDLTNGWLYDRRMKVLIHGLFGGHELFAKTLYAIYNDIEWFDEEDAEKYINENYGCFISRTCNMFVPIKADTFIFTDEEYVLDSTKVKGQLGWRGVK